MGERSQLGLLHHGILWKTPAYREKGGREGGTNGLQIVRDYCITCRSARIVSHMGENDLDEGFYHDTILQSCLHRKTEGTIVQCIAICTQTRVTGSFSLTHIQTIRHLARDLDHMR